MPKSRVSHAAHHKKKRERREESAFNRIRNVMTSKRSHQKQVDKELAKDQAIINSFSNYQRTEWARAGYPISRLKEFAKLKR